MFIAIIGTRCSGCSTIENYLVYSKGFTPIRLVTRGNESDENIVPSSHIHRNGVDRSRVETTNKHLSFLTFDATPLPSPLEAGQDHAAAPITFTSRGEILDYVTRNWQSDFVTTDLKTREMVEEFVTRPFFLLMSLDAPILERYRRSNSTISFHSFALEDDELRFGKTSHSLNGMADLMTLRVVNDFPSVSAFHTHIESLDLLDPSRLRPDWETYFMTLASLASQRSNCMKRRVGAILVRDKRIVSTGYNGTPRGVRNCNEGGCPRCNRGSETLSDADECVCLHAEENALLEAGRERVGKGSVLYCNTCPCLKCTVKIIQTGVESVVYNLSYKVDAASAKLFKEAGVQLRRYDPTATKHPAQEESYDTSTIDLNASDEENE